ncbi:hypothetical protein MFFC18_08510 [Mariniblastus fucicola]|uniref:Uncharacterized protein n=1 Tax=Mariniblastus fucicola TaxID=980251 RepID=A0A5B9P652_9BACT|nr:hypothetical protein MFFC18_08510 [Mariniblastus fucicola]
MTEQFLSLKEAAQHTGKSHSSLRRFLEKITKADDHSDRGLIQPDVTEVARLHAENHPFSWRVSTVLLDREFAKQGSGESDTTKSTSQASETAYQLLSKTIEMLQTELAAKNKQIDEFLARQKETNILMLPKGQQQAGRNDEAVTVYTSSTEEEGSKPSQSNSDQDSTPDPQSKQKRESLWDKMRKPLFQR